VKCQLRKEISMALIDCTSIGRYGATVIVAAVLTALAVASSGPAWGQNAGDADGAPTNPFPANTFHAFLLDDGEFTTIDPPGASGALTAATGINDHGQVVGYYFESGRNNSPRLPPGREKACSPRSIIRMPR
jgi:hypothetical protein